MNLHESNIYLRKNLAVIYNSREAAVISDWVLEKITGLNRLDRLMYKDQMLSSGQEQRLTGYLQDLLSHKPVQYVLGEADFYGLKFFVNDQVLIPRPETEELVQWIITDHKEAALSLLDIGTGSGCIPIAIKAKKTQFRVSACDISEGAISVAMKNAELNNVDIHFFLCDILNSSQASALDLYNIIVSNPPYIPPAAKTAMSANVLNYEPHTALFTPGDDPFIFYRSIGLIGRAHLLSGGKLYFEIHEEGADGVIDLLEKQGYNNIVLRNDLYGRPRMISAER